MRLTFLGTGAATPSRTRNVTSVGLQFDQRSALWLFDCGEGTQHQILRSPLRLSQLEHIFITHLHGDHFFGLLGLLASRSLQEGSDSPVTLHGPAGLDEYLRCALSVSRMRFRYPADGGGRQAGEVFRGRGVHGDVRAAGPRHRVLRLRRPGETQAGAVRPGPGDRRWASPPARCLVG